MEEKGYYCPECGTFIKDGQSICSKCGYSSLHREKKKKLLHPLFLWITFAVIAYIFSFFIFGISCENLKSIDDYVICIACHTSLLCALIILASMFYFNRLYNIEKRIIELSEYVKNEKK